LEAESLKARKLGAGKPKSPKNLKDLKLSAGLPGFQAPRGHRFQMLKHLGAMGDLTRRKHPERSDRDKLRRRHVIEQRE
jgi:hypothetical protein